MILHVEFVEFTNVSSDLFHSFTLHYLSCSIIILSYVTTFKVKKKILISQFAHTFICMICQNFSLILICLFTCLFVCFFFLVHRIIMIFIVKIDLSTVSFQSINHSFICINLFPILFLSCLFFLYPLRIVYHPLNLFLPKSFLYRFDLIYKYMINE